MKTKKVLILGILPLLLMACSNQDDSPSTTETRQVSPIDSVHLLVDKTEGFIYSGDDPVLIEKFKALSDEELDTYFQLMGEKVAQQYSNEDGMSLNELQELDSYFYTLFRITNEYSKKQRGKLLNNISLDQYALLLDEFGAIIAEEAVKDMSIEFRDAQKLRLEGGLSNSRRTSSKSLSCLQNNYNIKTYVSLKSSHRCLSFIGATYVGDDDCDYEFIFSWDKQFSLSPDYMIGLKAHSTGALAVLAAGKIRGRIDAEHNTVRFLIGKDRIRYAQMSALNFSQNITGNW